MYWQKTISRTGKTRYVFRYYDEKEGKNKTFPVEETPVINNDEEANEFCKKMEEALEAARFRIAQKLKWRTRFHNFQELIEIYKTDRKEKAPKSWEMYVSYLEKYILPFFLQEKMCRNVLLWPEYFEAFKDHLGVVSTIRNQGKGTLAWRTKNHILTTLNTFTDCMYRKRKIKEKIYPVELWPEKLMNRRNGESVYRPHEIEAVYEGLKAISELEADFFLTLGSGGFRINEGKGLSLGDFGKGRPDDSEQFHQFNSDLDHYKVECLGHVFLESQPANRRGPIRKQDGTIPRGALKGKPAIEWVHSRVIPVSDKRFYNVLVKRWNEALRLHKTQKYGGDKKNYLLFEGLKIHDFYKHLHHVCKAKGIRYRSPHCLRHTFATLFSGKLRGHNTLVRRVLGHTTEKQTLRYVHLYDQMNRDASVELVIELGEEMEYLE